MSVAQRLPYLLECQSYAYEKKWTESTQLTENFWIGNNNQIEKKTLSIFFLIRRWLLSFGFFVCVCALFHSLKV